MGYVVKESTEVYGRVLGMEEAVELAEEFLADATENGEDATVTVETAEGRLVASLSNRGMPASFHKQEWNDRVDMLQYIGEEVFDATTAVLLLSHENLMKLRDNNAVSDDIGTASVDWPGPFYVEVEEAVCAYFGVGDIRDITPEALSFARQRVNPQPSTEQVITLSVKLTLRVAPGASVSEFVENLDYSVVSNTAGVTVRNTEIVDSN